MKQFVLLFFLFSWIPSFSCICWNEDFPLKYLNPSEIYPDNLKRFIIKGRVIDNQVGANVYNRWGPGNLANIKVLEYWPKDGGMNDTITLFDDEGTCGVFFMQDSIYLIGAWNAHRYLATSRCEGTGLFSEYAHLVESLGEPGLPKTRDSIIPHVDQENKATKINIYLLIALGFSIVLNVYILFKSKTKNK
jgi:hypothetical protein